MHIVLDLQSIHQINNPGIRRLVRQRIQGLTDQGIEIDEIGHFVVVDTTDTVATIERHLGVSISTYEFIEEFPSCFNLVFVLEQSGAGVELFLPKEDGIDADLISICRMSAFLSPPEDAP